MAVKTYLFTVTHFVVRAGAVLMLLFAALMTLGEGALFVGLFNLDGNHLGIPAVLHPDDIPSAVEITRDTVFAVGMPVVGALLAGALVFALIFHLTAKIVESANLADPFVGQNASRLNQIGWLLLGVQMAGWCMTLLLEPLLQKIPGARDGLMFDLSPIGLVGVLLIFVLAQVFRRGSEMRAELEGIV
jgi:hypothetical protein